MATNDEDGEAADFSGSTWDPDSCRYGLVKLLSLREGMLPIEKPMEVAHLKFLICPSVGTSNDDRDRSPEPDRTRAKTASSKGKGKDAKEKNKIPANQTSGGRYVADMGRTEIMPNFHKGQWWRNVGVGTDVIVRDQFSLASPEIDKVSPGHYVQQGGMAEIFVSGQATGLQRMPVQPRGWVTVDASAVGGPRYLEPVPHPRWKVVFSSGSQKGDIVVRESVSLDSEEVAVILCGSFVEQSGPSETLEDGIIRMPITFEASSPSQPSSRTRNYGWVTCDASAQGGPRFFVPTQEEPPAGATSKATAKKDHPQNRNSQQQRGGYGAKGGKAHDHEYGGTNHHESNSWSKNRVWKVCNLEDGIELPVFCQPEPFAPGIGRRPQRNLVVGGLHTGDIVEQVGHSKKMRGHMVMPIRIIESENGGNSSGDQLMIDGQKADGWVTRRVVDKQKEADVGVWFEELADEGDSRAARREARNQRRKGDDGDD